MEKEQKPEKKPEQKAGTLRPWLVDVVVVDGPR